MSGIRGQPSVMLGAVRHRIGYVFTPSNRSARVRALLCRRHRLLLLGLCFAGLACAALSARRKRTVGLSFGFCRLRYVPRRLCGFNRSYRCPIWRRWECARSDGSVVREEARWRQVIVWHHRRRVTSVGTAFRRLSLVSSWYEPRRGRIEIGIEPLWRWRIVRNGLNGRGRLTARRGRRSSVGGLPFRVIVRCCLDK